MWKALLFEDHVFSEIASTQTSSGLIAEKALGAYPADKIWYLPDPTDSDELDLSALYAEVLTINHDRPILLFPDGAPTPNTGSASMCSGDCYCLFTPTIRGECWTRWRSGDLVWWIPCGTKCGPARPPIPLP